MRDSTAATRRWAAHSAESLCRAVSQCRGADRRIDTELVEMSLAELRRDLGVTQENMAGAIKITQSQLSKLERRDDHLVSTLRRAVHALGGELEVTAVVGKRRVKLSV